MLTDASRLADFPSLADRVYLNTAAEGIPPRTVPAALAQYAADHELGMDGRALHEDQWAETRALVATAYGLSAEEIGLCACTSEAYNLAALALRLAPGDEVVVNDLDFPSGATPWLQHQPDATVRLWESRDGALRVEDLAPLLGPRTRLVATSLVSFYNGFKIPMADVVATVRSKSPALLSLDVTQALGRIPLDLSAADLIISSTHKWILGSHGGGLVGVPRRHAETWTVPAGGWFQIENAFDKDRFERTALQPATVRQGANSFMLGMPNYAAIYAARAALDYNLQVGPTEIDRACAPLMRQAMDGLKTLDVEVITPDETDALAGIISFLHPKAEIIHQKLHQQRIHVMHHAGRIRIAVHGYNTAEDIEAALRVLEEALNHV